MTENPRRGVAGSRIPTGLLLAPFQVLVSIISVMIAASFLVQSLSISTEPVSILQAILAPPWVWVWGAFMAGGGILALIGVFRRSPSSISTEILGLGILSTAWFVYSVGLALEVGLGGLIPVSFGIAVVFASTVRAKALMLASGVSKTTGG